MRIHRVITLWTPFPRHFYVQALQQAKMRNMREKGRKDQRLVMTAQVLLVCKLIFHFSFHEYTSLFMSSLHTSCFTHTHTRTHKQHVYVYIYVHLCTQDIGAALQVHNVKIVKPEHLGPVSGGAAGGSA